MTTETTITTQARFGLILRYGNDAIPCTAYLKLGDDINHLWIVSDDDERLIYRAASHATDAVRLPIAPEYVSKIVFLKGDETPHFIAA